ncbi:MAG: TRAP transporter small permease [Bacillota bacterium]
MKKTLHSTAVKISNILERVTAYPLILIGGAMVVVVLVGTFWRYVLRSPFLWTEELARYLMIWMALIAASISLKEREHVGIRLVIDKVPERPRKIIRFITQIFMLLFLYYLTREGFTMAGRGASQSSPALGISMFWPLLAVPLAGLFTGLQLILQMVIDMTAKEEA